MRPCQLCPRRAGSLILPLILPLLPNSWPQTGRKGICGGPGGLSDPRGAGGCPAPSPFQRQREGTAPTRNSLKIKTKKGEERDVSCPRGFCCPGTGRVPSQKGIFLADWGGCAVRGAPSDFFSAPRADSVAFPLLTRTSQSAGVRQPRPGCSGPQILAVNPEREQREDTIIIIL